MNITPEQIAELERKAYRVLTVQSEAKAAGKARSHIIGTAKGLLAAAADPTTILALIGRNRELEEAVRKSYRVRNITGSSVVLCAYCHEYWHADRARPDREEEHHEPDCIVLSLEVSHADVP